MNRTGFLAIALLACLPALSVQAADHPTGIGAEIRRDLAEARREVRVDLAKARRDLDTENLRIDDGMQFGHDDGRKAARASTTRPRAEITPQGDLLIAGKAQPIDANQRRLLLTYRGQSIAIAREGIDIGERTATAALDAIGNGSWTSLLFGAMTGSLERKVDRVVRQQVEPAVRGLCRKLPALMETQQRLSASLPAFRPYATLEADDVADCEADVRNEFASR